MIRDRIDSFPTATIAGHGVRPGRPVPFGATLVPGGVNFSVFSTGARAVSLVLYRRGARQPFTELPFPEEFRVGGVWAMTVFGLDYDDVEYGYRVAGPVEPRPGDRYDDTVVVADPYARSMSGRSVWGAEPDRSDPFPYRSRLAFDDFDWDGDAPLRIPADELVVYEAHVRGFTRHPSSGVGSPGTYAGLVEKIPYLQSLGVNCVELLPVFEFDEFENGRFEEATGRRLWNYWGYSTVGFFAPKAGYAATGRWGMAVDEFRNMVKQFHRAGIEVMLDVVFNHTAEGNEHGPTISFRGLDNAAYYLLTPTGGYCNYSGTGNTLNCNHPVVRGFILDALRYWAAEYHIDGFRFDLASILDRGQDGAPLPNPPLLEALAHDPVLRDCKLVAEAWDAGGLYQVGSFPSYQRWSEWNGRYRDTVRRWIKGDMGLAGDLATCLVGSPDLYRSRGPLASVNFVTCHDGFTLADLVSYDGKHNDANGEDNRDGSNDNHSWNHGTEGVTADPAVTRLRLQQMKNALLLLLTSQGIPMILAGDERARSQGGNNNAYCHDDEISWVDWTPTPAGDELTRFVAACTALRRAHPVLRGAAFPTGSPGAGSGGSPDISWHGTSPWSPDWSATSRVLGLLRVGPPAPGGRHPDAVYLVSNTHWEDHDVEPPPPPAGTVWHLAIDTGEAAPHDVAPPSPATWGARGVVRARSSVVLVAAPGDGPPGRLASTAT